MSARHLRFAALFATYALVLALVLLDIRFGTPGQPHRILMNLLVVAVTLEAGHIVLSYFLLWNDRLLRARFPWWSFLALNAAVFAVFYTWRKELLTTYALYFFCAYDIIRHFHNTRQAYGVARIFAADEGAPSAGRHFGLYVLAVQVAGYLGTLNKSFVPPSYTRYYAGLALTMLPTLAFAALLTVSFRQPLSPPAPEPAAKKAPWAVWWLGRYSFLSLARLSEVAPSFVRAVHGVEYYYIFLRFFRGRRAVITAGFAAAVVLQVVFTVSQLQRLGYVSGGFLEALTPVMDTLFFTHMFQDWWVFAHDKPSRTRFREVALAPRTA